MISAAMGTQMASAIDICAGYWPGCATDTEAAAAKFTASQNKAARGETREHFATDGAGPPGRSPHISAPQFRVE